MVCERFCKKGGKNVIAIQWEDVIGVLQTCAPYLIALGILWVVAVIVMVAVRTLQMPKRKMVRGYAALSMVLSLAVVANLIGLGPMAALLDLSSGEGTVSDETTQEAIAVANQIAEEGTVLLKNDGLLPLKNTKNLNLFGWTSANPVYGGTGSGGLNELYEKTSLIDSLTQAGFSVNQELVDFYNAYTSDRPEMSLSKQSWTLPEPPAATYSQELMDNAKAFSDTAVIVLGRIAGEGHNDMPADVSQAAYDNNSTEYADFAPGEHYLQLSQTEEDMIQLVCENFSNVIVLYNAANPMELGFVEEYPQIRAALWCQGPGHTGFEAIGKILNGEVNPSGKTTDTFVYDLTATPWWNNWQSTKYSNMENMAVEGMNSGMAQTYYPSFVNYVEGIYVGYKFYETAAAEGFLDYDATVQYPFGYGLSYTTFTQTMSDLSVEDTTVSFDVTVTNTGSVAGKDVVEVYYNPPYQNGGIEKAAANLIRFDKTDLLEPGASQTIPVSFDLEEMASYDTTGTGCYVLEAGDYQISINSDSHTVLDQKTCTVDQTVRYEGENKRASDQVAATNQFGDAAGDVTYLSRADGFANYDQATAAPAPDVMSDELVSQYHLNSNFDYTTYIDPDAEMPVTGADNGMKLADLRGAAYDDPRWDTLLDQLTVDEMSNMIALSGYQTPAMESVGKVATVDADGPAAINNNFTGGGSIGFPVEVMLACTWNQDLAKQYGTMMGKMCREMNIAGWYAPGMNTHRTAFGARNYEYFSEDGTLAGYLSAATVQGAASQGVYAYIKHLALYEMNAKMVCVWANEQAIREIYLKPFEIAVKVGDAHAVMVSWSFIGIKWSGENSNLLNNVLRGEWGFEGFALTDFFRNNGHGFMNADMALANGVDAMLSTYAGGPNVVQDPEAASSVQYMRRACKNVMYTVVNSWMYEDGAQNTGLAGWKLALFGADAVICVLLVGAGVVIARRYKKRNVTTK